MKRNGFEEYLECIRKIAKAEGYDSLNEIYMEHLRARYYGEDVIIGKGRRILLRELKLSDLETIYKFEETEAEPVLKAFIKETKEESRENLKAYITYMYPMYEYGIWAVELLDTKEVIGLCGLGHFLEKQEEAVDLGYYICPKFRKKGYASEGIEIVLEYTGNYLELPIIYATASAENRISRKILKKFGFSLMGEETFQRVLCEKYK